MWHEKWPRRLDLRKMSLELERDTVIPWRTFFKHFAQIDLDLFKRLALRLVNAHSPSQDQRQLLNTSDQDKPLV